MVTDLLFVKSFCGAFEIVSGRINDLFFTATSESGKWEIATNKKHMSDAQARQVFATIRARHEYGRGF